MILNIDMYIDNGFWNMINMGIFVSIKYIGNKSFEILNLNI